MIWLCIKHFMTGAIASDDGALIAQKDALSSIQGLLEDHPLRDEYLEAMTNNEEHSKCEN